MMPKIIKRIGNTEITYEANTVKEIESLFNLVDRKFKSPINIPGTLNTCLLCGHTWEGDVSRGCPNVANHKSKGAEMKTWLVRQKLKDLLAIWSDIEFEKEFSDLVDELYEPKTVDHSLKNYQTVDELRKTLDSLEVEPEDIIAAYQKEISCDILSKKNMKV
jgi:hypothetical protein